MSLIPIFQASTILILYPSVDTDEFRIWFTDGFLAKAFFVNKTNKSYLAQGARYKNERRQLFE